METKTAVSKLKDIILKRKKILIHQNSSSDKWFTTVFNMCLDRLHYEYRKLILECYVNKQFKFWWMEYYSKSSFYRARAKAVVCFVSLFEMIYENLQVATN